MPVNNDLTDRHFSEMARACGVNKSGNEDKYTVIKSLLQPAETHPKVLECGGGAGFYTQRLLQDGYRVTCVDLSADALEVNRRQAAENGHGGDLKTVHNDVVRYCRETRDVFDQAVFIKVFHHFENLDSIWQALDGALGLCRPGGQVMIFEPNGRNILWKPLLMLARDKTSGKRKWHFERNMQLTVMQHFLSYCGDRSLPCIPGYHYVIPAALLNRDPSGLALKVNRVLERTVLKYQAFNISMVIRKEAGETPVAGKPV